MEDKYIELKESVRYATGLTYSFIDKLFESLENENERDDVYQFLTWRLRTGAIDPDLEIREKILGEIKEEFCGETTGTENEPVVEDTPVVEEEEEKPEVDSKEEKEEEKDANPEDTTELANSTIEVK